MTNYLTSGLTNYLGQYSTGQATATGGASGGLGGGAGGNQQTVQDGREAKTMPASIEWGDHSWWFIYHPRDHWIY